MAPKVVTYTDEHFDGVRTLWEQAFPNPKPWNAPEYTVSKKLAAQPNLFIVAVDGDRVIGSAMAGYDGTRGWLYAVAVLEAYRRRGTGSALVHEAERRLLDLGCAKINLQVQSSNADVSDFYKHLGYEVEERISMGKS